MIVDTKKSPHARLRPVPASAVRLTGGLLAERRRTVLRETLPSQFLLLESTGRLARFRRAAGAELAYSGAVYDDSDVYKWLEAAAWAEASGEDGQPTSLADTVLSLVVAAQDETGYLNTAFVGAREADRWTNLRDWHELYCAGHLIQAALARQRTSGREDLLRVAIRLADHLCGRFGQGEGLQQGTPGHPGIEMALVELYRQTGAGAYLELARYFLDARGHGLIGGQAYHQDHRPFRELDRMTGHAVRMAYLCAGAADLFLERGDGSLKEVLESLWERMTTRQIYLTGGIGARARGEAFGDDFELPNQSAYAETCAAVGALYWSWRMLLMDGRSAFADLIERILYNGALVGLSADGRSYFYRNILESSGGFGRQTWYDCACCPPNIARLYAQLPGYFYGVSQEGLWLHLYGENEAKITLPDGRRLVAAQETRYPWAGNVDIRLDLTGPLTVFLRQPGWCAESMQVGVNGEATATKRDPGGYLKLSRDWAPGDTIQITLPMEVRQTHSHPYVRENQGRRALERGPLVYCFEQVDHPDLNPQSIRVSPAAQIQPSWDPGLFEGMVVLRGAGWVEGISPDWARVLYRPGSVAAAVSSREARLTAIPYFAWANRGSGWMQVWVRST